MSRKTIDVIWLQSQASKLRSGGYDLAARVVQDFIRSKITTVSSK